MSEWWREVTTNRTERHISEDNAPEPARDDGGAADNTAGNLAHPDVGPDPSSGARRPPDAAYPRSAVEPGDLRGLRHESGEKRLV